MLIEFHIVLQIFLNKMESKYEPKHGGKEQDQTNSKSRIQIIARSGRQKKSNIDIRKKK